MSGRARRCVYSRTRAHESSVKVAYDLATYLTVLSLDVVHDALGGGEDDVPEET